MNQNNIKTQELRLGNYFKDREGRVCRVEQICIEIEDTKILALYGATTSLPVEPIPLSEEMLLKCGFEKYQWQNAMYIKTVFGHLYLHFYKDRIITSFKSITYDYEGQKMKSLGFIGRKESVENIIYLHQLQNFYYSIAQTELEVSF